jgi:Zn-dependent peptidase ImmA (M78 family)
LNALVKFGNQLADAYANTRNARVAAAVTAWRNRGAVFRSQFVELATGLTQDQIQAIQGDQDASAYWDIAANTDWNSGQVFEGPLLAAARMTAGILDTPSIKRVVGSIRGLKKHRSDELDNLAAKATTFLAGKQARFAFEGGYLVADFFRTGCLELTRKYVDIENLLRRLNVELLEIDFGATRIDAVALWGGRGPCIAMNSAREFASDSKRTRMTWAHELCHLLVDRKGGLPFCEVLGGQVDDFIERRANAFAAELLLPRASVEHEWHLWTTTFSEFLLMLSHEYGVSKSVACAQIYNSLAFEKLDQTAQTYVIGRLQHFEKGEQDDTIRTAEGVV